MFFPTHLLIGVLLGRGRHPTSWVVLGAALPDLIDKPLGAVGVVDTYHSVAHSALLGAAVVVVLLAARRAARGPDAGAGAIVPVLVGWASHLGADALHITLNGRPENTVFLLWPVVDSWDSIDAGPGLFIVQYVGTASFYLEVVLWVCGGYVLSRTARAGERPGR